MRKYLVLLTVFCALMTAGIGPAADPLPVMAADVPGYGAAEAKVMLPPADGEKLGEFIMKQNPYRKWKLWPGKRRLYKGTEPHGVLLTTYVNKIAFGSLKAKKGMQNGSIIAKENYDPSKNYMALTVMYKVEGYNPEAGDWFWAKYDPKGKLVDSGKLKGCIDCHASNVANDYVLTEKIK